MGIKTSVITSKVTVAAGSSAGIDVRDFGSITGSNFDTTVRAAITAAYNASGAPDNAPGNRGGVNVLIPSGVYTLGSTLSFPGSLPKYTPGLVGMGEQGGVKLVWDQSSTGPWISTGSEVPGGEFVNYTYCQTFKNLELRSNGSPTSGGIKSRAGFHQHFDTVMVRMEAQNQSWANGIAFDLGESSAGDLNQNHQHPSFFRCRSDYAQIGFYFAGSVWTVMMVDCHSNGSAVAGAVYDGAVVTWHGGNTQCGPSATNAPYWWAGTKQPAHTTGWTVTAGHPSGTGASLSVASGQFCTLTGLTGLSGYKIDDAVQHAGCWIELTDPSPGNPDRISGIYRIEKVLSGTSCVIRKGSDHGAKGSLTYQVRGSRGGSKVSLEGIYHEGGASVLVHTGPEPIGVPTNFWTVRSCEANNCDGVIDAFGGSISVENTGAPGGYSGRLHHVQKFTTDQAKSTVSADTFSRIGLVCRIDTAAVGGPGVSGHIWESVPKAHRYNRALKQQGFCEIWDARVESSVTKSGDNISKWTGIINGLELNRVNAGVSPQYISLDSNLGSPAVKFIGAVAAPSEAAGQAAVGALKTTAVDSVFPTGSHGVTIIAIGRLPDLTTSIVANRVIRFACNTSSTGDDMDIQLHWNDGVWQTGSYAFFYNGTPHITQQTAALASVDTRAHILIGTQMAGRQSIGGASESLEWSVADNVGEVKDFGWTTPATGGSLSIGEFFGLNVPATNGDLYISHIAIAPFGLTAEEIAAFIDLARNEFDIA